MSEQNQQPKTVISSESFEKLFESLCNLLGSKPSEQTAVLGKYDDIYKYKDRDFVWFKSYVAKFWWRNGIVDSLTIPTANALGHQYKADVSNMNFYDYKGVRLGMSKARVHELWGEPSNEFLKDDDQVWYYEHKLPYIERGSYSLKADLNIGFDDNGLVTSFGAILDGPLDGEFKRLMQRCHYCLSEATEGIQKIRQALRSGYSSVSLNTERFTVTKNLDEVLQCATKAEELLDGGGGGDYIDDKLITPEIVRDKASNLRADLDESFSGQNSIVSSSKKFSGSLPILIILSILALIGIFSGNVFLLLVFGISAGAYWWTKFK